MVLILSKIYLPHNLLLLDQDRMAKMRVEIFLLALKVLFCLLILVIPIVQKLVNGSHYFLWHLSQSSLKTSLMGTISIILPKLSQLFLKLLQSLLSCILNLKPLLNVFLLIFFILMLHRFNGHMRNNEHLINILDDCIVHFQKQNLIY